jgi:hypothetical protein
MMLSLSANDKPSATSSRRKLLRKLIRVMRDDKRRLGIDPLDCFVRDFRAVWIYRHLP